MNKPQNLTIVNVTQSDLPKLEAFLRKDAARERPVDPGAPQAFVDGLRRSLQHFDFLSSPAHWLLAAEVDGEYVGYLMIQEVHT